MKSRRIGVSDLEIAPLMLGGNLFGWTLDQATSFAILDRFVDAGFNAIDTADIYSCWVPGNSGGESETIIGEWFKARGGRDRVILATKVGGLTTDWSKGYLTADHIIQAVDRSLSRLQTDYIDLYQSHSSDQDTPIEETLTAYAKLIEAGKVRFVGASHYSPDELGQAVIAAKDPGLPAYQSLQLRYNMYDRDEFESGLRDLCIEHGIGVLCYSSLAKGFLSGAFSGSGDFANDKYKAFLESYADARGERILAALRQVAAAREVSCSEVALAWLSAQPGVTAPIFAVETIEQLDMALGGARLELTDEDLHLLGAASQIDAA